MIKLLVFVVVLLAVQNILDAAVTTLPPQKVPPGFEGQEGCYVPALNKVLRFDLKYDLPNTNCTQYTCQKNGETLVETCDVKPVEVGCFKIAGKTPVYPGCCDTVYCYSSKTTTKATSTSSN